MRARIGAPALVLLVLVLGTAGGVSWSAFSATTTNPGNSFTAASAFLDHFEFDPISEAHDGKSFVVTVRAKSASGATVTSFNGTVSFSTNSGSITPTTSYQFVNGVLTQAVTITGSYNAGQTITATGSGATGTSAAFTLHDWDFYFKKTTANTGSSCASATRLRDMEEGYTGSDPEETFSRTTGGAIHLRFCSPTFSAGDTLAAGTTTVTAWTFNSAGSGCQVTVFLYKVSGATATSLGSTALTVPQNSGSTQRTWTINTSGTTFAAGDRLAVHFQLQDVKACDSTDIKYGGTVNRSHAQLPGPGGSAYSDAVLGTSNLAAYWRLGEASGTTADDAKGTNNGVFTNGVTLGATGLLATDNDTAASFDGVNDYVTVPDAAALDTTSQVSIEAWIKPTSVTGTGNIIRKDGAYTFRRDTTGLNFFFWTGGSTAGTSAGSQLTSGTAYYVVATYDGSTARIYKNGVQVGSSSVTGAIANSASTLEIGRYGPGNSEFWAGTLDEVAVYSRALSASEVKAHYDAR